MIHGQLDKYFAYEAEKVMYNEGSINNKKRVRCSPSSCSATKTTTRYECHPARSASSRPKYPWSVIQNRRDEGLSTVHNFNSIFGFLQRHLAVFHRLLTFRGPPAVLHPFQGTFQALDRSHPFQPKSVVDIRRRPVSHRLCVLVSWVEKTLVVFPTFRSALTWS